MSLLHTTQRPHNLQYFQ